MSELAVQNRISSLAAPVAASAGVPFLSPKAWWCALTEFYWKATRSRWEALGWLILLALLAAVCPLAVRRAIDDGGTDFPEFYQAGRYVLEHAARQPQSILAYYWPSLDVAWAALAWMPLGVAAFVWYATISALWIALMLACGRHLLGNWSEMYQRQAALAAGLLVLPLVLDHLCLGAFHIAMLFFMVAGLGRISVGRWRSGGVLLGLAIWIKLLPALAVPYLLFKGKWRPAILAVVTAVLLNVILSVGVFGPKAAWQYHLQWWDQQVHGTTERIFTGGVDSAEHRCKNQSLAAVLRRTLTPLFVMGQGNQWCYFSLADVPPIRVRQLYYASLLGMAAVLAYLCRRRPHRMNESDWAVEIALLVLATMWFSPVVWSYHPTAVLPALVVIVAREDQRKVDVWLCIVLWVAAMALIGWDTARAYGEMFWMSWLLAAWLCWARRIGPPAVVQEGLTATVAPPTVC